MLARIAAAATTGCGSPGAERRARRGGEGARGARRRPDAAALWAALRGQGQYRRRRPGDHLRLSRFRLSCRDLRRRLSSACARRRALVGKTNLDQFATGLVGVRSPYGVPRNPFDPAYIPGGSSSGSAVAVPRGWCFALGTDTAGSGRVPASFNNIVGLKPTPGLSTSGVVPACRSLDCVSVFTLTVEDAAAVADIARARCGRRLFARGADWFRGDGADAGALRLWRSVGRATRVLWQCRRPRALSRGDRAAEGARRRAGGDRLTPRFSRSTSCSTPGRGSPSAMARSATRSARGTRCCIRVCGGSSPAARRFPGADAFAGRHRRRRCARRSDARCGAISTCWCCRPPARRTGSPRSKANPIEFNANLGRYTNFCNLLDLAAIAVPAGFRGDGLPFGVTLFAPALHDPLIAAVGAALHRTAGLKLGATGCPHPETVPGREATSYPYVAVAVVGAHLSGQPLNGQLAERGARLRRTTRTAAEYRLYALADGKRPGLVRRPGAGVAIEVEVWDLPSAALGGFAAAIPAPLGLGRVTLEDGSEVTGFLCEAHAVESARDISEFGGWRAWLAAQGKPS